MLHRKPGGVTIPGEAGYEALTLRVAEKWGADVIRDSDGTALSERLLDSDYKIYSTVCVIRGHNAWLKEHPHCLQQTFLLTAPLPAFGQTLSVPIMREYDAQQFRANDSARGFSYWQVFDRTTGEELPRSAWRYDAAAQTVVVLQAVPYHTYTVTFLAYRIWEEISMYNAVTNDLRGEHLMPLETFYPESRAYLRDWMEAWCRAHPHTDVVRFTSLFYNFVWIWGSDPENRTRFTDWASYDFTVSDAALDAFAAQGHAVQLEDFLDHGRRATTHRPESTFRRTWREFIQRYVQECGAELVSIVHRHGKQAMLFYDDSWVGTEPCSPDFRAFGFDGIIKCLFSGFEARLCASVDTPVHELRVHPYLFPTGVNGEPSFLSGGDPESEVLRYWLQLRPALLRKKIDRIGFGGYLHLLEGFDGFTDRVASLMNEFRTIRALHETGPAAELPVRVGVLHTWGSLRPWTLNGHFHETYRHDLIQINEALSALPVQVRFLSFDDVRRGALAQVDVLISAGAAGTAWSGGAAWDDPEIAARVTQFAAEGGALIGVGEPGAQADRPQTFRMAHVLGVDEDTAACASCAHPRFAPSRTPAGLVPQGAEIEKKTSVCALDSTTQIWMQDGQDVLLSYHPFGRGCGIYLSSFRKTDENTRLLLHLLLLGAKLPLAQDSVPDNVHTVCALFPDSGCAALVNTTALPQKTRVRLCGDTIETDLAPYEGRYLERQRETGRWIPVRVEESK